MIRDAAYQSLLKARRQEYHARIAKILEDGFPEIIDTQPELIAYHYTEGGLAERAIIYWKNAGERAIERSANMEAINYLTKSLELLTTLPSGMDRIQQELDLQVALGQALIAAKGYANSDVEKAYARALELCRQVGEGHKTLPLVLWGLSAFYVLRGRFQIALKLAEQLLSLAKSTGKQVFFIQAHFLKGVTLYSLGEQTSSLEHFEQGIAIYDTLEQHSTASFHEQNAGVLCLSFRAIVMWLLGYPSEASDKIQRTLDLADGFNYPFNRNLAGYYAAILHQLRREPEEAKR